MKRISIIITIIIAALLLSTVSFAEPIEMSAPVGQKYVPYAETKPVFDGIINADEWANAVKFTIDQNNAKSIWQSGYDYVPEDDSIVMYALWDEDYLYVAYDVTDTTKVYWTEDKFDNGDAIQLFIDIDGTLSGIDLNDNVQIGGNRAPMFASAIQVKEDGSLGTKPLWIHQAVVDSFIITDYKLYPACGSLTENGWMFEEAIPWSTLAADIKVKCDVDIDTVGAGTEVSALLAYLDYTSHTTVKCFFGTTITGYEEVFDEQPADHGILFTLLGKGETAPETTEPEITTAEETTAATEAVTTASSTTEATATALESGTEADVTTEAAEEDNGGSNLGLIIGIAAAAVVVIAVVVTVIVKKKK